MYICVYVYIVQQACHAAVQWLSDKYNKVGIKQLWFLCKLGRGRVSVWSPGNAQQETAPLCAESTAEAPSALGFSRVGHEVTVTNMSVPGGSLKLV